MLFPTLGALLLATSVVAQDLTEFVGTWSSGSGKVITGPNFADPSEAAFKYPDVAGISYSFTDDGYFELARYRFISNGSEPNCIRGVLGWLHGTWEVLSNTSIVMTPIWGDGYQQIQDPCAARSNFVENYNGTELYSTYAFSTDTADGRRRFQLFEHNGVPLPPMFLISETPTMLPTNKLRNVSAPATVDNQKRELGADSGSGDRVNIVDKAAVVVSMAALGLSSLLI